MFKVDSKDTRTTPFAISHLVLVFLLLALAGKCWLGSSTRHIYSTKKEDVKEEGRFFKHQLQKIRSGRGHRFLESICGICVEIIIFRGYKLLQTKQEV